MYNVDGESLDERFELVDRGEGAEDVGHHRPAPGPQLDQLKLRQHAIHFSRLSALFSIRIGYTFIRGCSIHFHINSIDFRFK